MVQGMLSLALLRKWSAVHALLRRIEALQHGLQVSSQTDLEHPAQVTP